MSKRQFLAALIGLVTAAACARLGLWQIDRLHQRQLVNDLKVARLVAPPTLPFGLLAGTRMWRRITVSGTFEFDHQFVLTGQSHDGAPGVYVITPFTPDEAAEPILVNRGWVYSADAQTVELRKVDEAPHQTINGYVDEFVVRGDGPVRSTSTPYAWRRLDASEIFAAFPAGIAPFYLVAQADSGAPPKPGAPVRLPLPSLDEGPHRGYAIQWFAFALIALGGAGVIIWRDRRAPPAGNPGVSPRVHIM